MQTDAATRGGTALLARLCRRMRALARTRAQPFPSPRRRVGLRRVFV
jgi:hypothetical protein